MTRTSSLIWLTLVLILLLPTTAGRFLLDLAGGLMLAFFTLPLIIAGIGWVGWRVFQSKLVTCEVCGATSMKTSPACPICGSSQLKIHVARQNEAVRKISAQLLIFTHFFYF